MINTYLQPSTLPSRGKMTTEDRREKVKERERENEPSDEKKEEEKERGEEIGKQVEILLEKKIRESKKKTTCQN